jgi:hypothetical protein
VEARHPPQKVALLSRHHQKIPYEVVQGTFGKKGEIEKEAWDVEADQNSAKGKDIIGECEPQVQSG